MTITRFGDYKLKHDRRSHYAILKRCSPKAVRGGWNRLGTVCRYTNGYGWCALDGKWDEGRYRTQRECLAAFAGEMWWRGGDAAPDAWRKE